MDKVRGMLMLGVGAFAIFRGVIMHKGANSWLAVALGAVAIALGVWRLTRKPPQRLT